MPATPCNARLQGDPWGSGFRVAVRSRPVNHAERVWRSQQPTSAEQAVNITDGQISVTNPIGVSRREIFEFDWVFDEKESNTSVYEQIGAPLMCQVLDGYNATIFCYGCTGAGKTHTMHGAVSEEGMLSLDAERGLYVLAVQDLFHRIDAASSTEIQSRFGVRVSFLEIYNEKIIDLLALEPAKQRTPLELQQDPVHGMVVPLLTEVDIASLQQVEEVLVFGTQRRTMGSTSNNAVSSRSHAIFQISLIQQTGKTITLSKLSLCDLAGSERAAARDHQGEQRGLRLAESAQINRSLFSLGNCINALADAASGQRVFVPYRNSKLTRLLKDALGGNSCTVMIANVSPSSKWYEDTRNTLKYATRARGIRNIVRQNTHQVAGR